MFFKIGGGFGFGLRVARERSEPDDPGSKQCAWMRIFREHQGPSILFYFIRQKRREGPWRESATADEARMAEAFPARALELNKMKIAVGCLNFDFKFLRNVTRIIIDKTIKT